MFMSASRLPSSLHVPCARFLRLVYPAYPPPAIFLRNHIIDLFEQAEVETDPARKRRLLTFVAIGAGLVGIELTGELTEFTHNLTRTYHHINPSELEFHLLEAGPKLMPEMERDLAEYAGEVLKRRGVRIMTNTPAQRIEPGKVYLPDAPTESGGAPAAAATFIESHTILLVAGVSPSPLLSDLPLEKDKKGRLIVESTMRSKARPEIWALGDCAHIPDP